jgi:DNA recombination protein RmuC
MTESLLLFLAVAAIGAAAWFAYRSAGVDPIRAERDRLRAELEALRRENVTLSADLAAAQAQRAERSESEEARFVEIAAKALQASQQSFMALANETFEKHKQSAQGGVKDVLTPAQEALAKLAANVEALEKARLQDKSAMGEQVRQIMDAVGVTNRTTNKLINVLRVSPKARGRWGEQTLRNVLELAGLSLHVDFTEQTTTQDGEGSRLRPDVVINIPGGRCITVDSKVALSAYLDAMDATDEEAREAFLKKHAAELRGHVKLLSSKEYWKHFPTADFVVMFVPGDSFLSAAAERDPALMDDAYASKVVITTPTTMVALAKLAAYMWRQEQSAKNAQEIADLGRDLFRRMAVMVDHMGKVGDAIGKSVKNYNEMIGSVESRVLPQARKFKELGAGDAGIDIAAPPQIEAAPRLPPPPEQLELMPPPQTKRGRGA